MTTRAQDAANFRGAVTRNPLDRVAWHNLASAEGDLGRLIQAEEAARRAIALGITAPETRLVLARALQGQRRLDDAQRVFEEAIALRPAYADAHRDLAQLIWMRGGDTASALVPLDAALAEAPADPSLHLIRSIVLEFAGDLPGAIAAADAGIAQAPKDTALLRQASHLCLESGDTPRAMTLAQRASQFARPNSVPEMITSCEALLAAGRIEEADATAEAIVKALPGNQYALALQATTWRIRGDKRYAAMCDYKTMVQAQKLDTPPGFESLEAFLLALTVELENLHAFEAHPLQQSVRGGSQLHIQEAEIARPLIGALFGSIAAAVQRHLQALGPGADILRARNTGKFGFSGAWSVRLRSGGHHTDHVHPQGWISSACYISLPEGVGAGGNSRAGWLRLGQPPIPTLPAIRADHHVKPEPGLLVLFPAYMWHGVEPFTSDGQRLSVAFDVVPA
ncbi:MAG: putative 2OG-Fe(II) oxygenase [Usitatibacter sp.]